MPECERGADNEDKASDKEVFITRENTYKRK